MRRWMLAVAAVAIIAVAGHLRSPSRRYRAVASLCAGYEATLRPSDPAGADRYAAMRDNYNWAASHPWMPVPPEPPVPRGPAAPFKF
jgi:hypothetical protein